MAKYLLDTHTAIWLFTDSKKLSDKARNILADRECHLAISIASVWEIAIKISKGGKITDMSGVVVFIDKLRENGIEILGKMYTLREANSCFHLKKATSPLTERSCGF